MSNQGTLYIKNSTSVGVTASVDGQGWNCCDSPNPGQQLGIIDSGATSQLAIIRKDGHGCNGEQGTFDLILTTPTYGLLRASVNFNADGGAGETLYQFTPGSSATHKLIGVNSDNMITIAEGVISSAQ